MMEVTILISSFPKIPGGQGGYIIEGRVQVNDSDIKELALKKFEDSRYSLNSGREYSAEIEDAKIKEI